MLRLYDLPRHAVNDAQIAALVEVAYRAASACLPGNPYVTFVRGTEILLTVEESGFVGSGLRLFAQVLERFFGLYAHVNSYTQLTLLSARTRETLLSCPPRSGENQLL